MAGMPLLAFEGPVADCGYALGCAWREALQAQCPVPAEARSRPWWEAPAVRRLVSRYAPHLPVLFEAMARGAEMPVERLVPLGPAQDGCTTFAIAGQHTADGIPFCGQTKDTPLDRKYRFQVLRLRFDDAPGLITLTYPGWLFGHGFAWGGCALWRNSLNTTGRPAGLPLPVWGLLATHCATVADVVEMTREHGIDTSCHTAVVDTKGGVAGIECTDGGIDVLQPENGIYVHANAVRGRDGLKKTEVDLETFHRSDSAFREGRFRELAERELGQLSPDRMLEILSDHENHPCGICRHQNDEAQTTAAVMAEPGRGILHVVQGHPCTNRLISFH
jgi:isopenicillin-N N-acyltransferase-like protein